MTQQTRAVIKAKFEQGDTPQGTDYEDWVDSTVFLSDTTAQALSSPLSVAGSLGASTAVSAESGEFTSVAVSGAVSALSLHAATGSVATFSANAVGITGSLVWTAEVTATVIGTGTQTVPGTAAGYIVVTVCGQTVGIPYFKVA